MQKCIMTLTFLFAVTCTVNAQLPDVNKAKTSTVAKAGQLLTQFAGALKTTSLTSSWATEKTGWLNKASKVTDALGMVQSISSLAGFIKPDMFKTGTTAGNLLQTANTVKTVAGAAGLLKNLEGGLKPEATTSAWATQRPAWLSALSLLK